MELGLEKKLHEEMISISEAINTVDLGKYYAILNEFAKNTNKNTKKLILFQRTFNIIQVFLKKNPDFLSISKHVDLLA